MQDKQLVTDIIGSEGVIEEDQSQREIDLKVASIGDTAEVKERNILYGGEDIQTPPQIRISDKSRFSVQTERPKRIDPCDESRTFKLVLDPETGLPVPD